jgi:hypothetical protein
MLRGADAQPEFPLFCPEMKAQDESCDRAPHGKKTFAALHLQMVILCQSEMNRRAERTAESRNTSADITNF